MIRKCLKCGESNPDATGDTLEACPKCGAIYTKVEAAQKVIEEKRRVLEEANARKAAADAKAAEAKTKANETKESQPASPTSTRSPPTGYVGRNLIPGEEVLYQGKLSFWSLLSPIVFGLLLLPVGGIGVLLWIYAFLCYNSTELAITNKRVIAKFGIISTRTIELNLNRIEGIQVIQSTLGHLFDYGSLIISGTGSSKEPIPGISSPLAFRQAFASAQDNIGKDTAAVVASSTVPAAAEKTCPQCAEVIKLAAKVCRFCGHRFEQVNEA